MVRGRRRKSEGEHNRHVTSTPDFYRPLLVVVGVAVVVILSSSSLKKGEEEVIGDEGKQGTCSPLPVQDTVGVGRKQGFP